MAKKNKIKAGKPVLTVRPDTWQPRDVIVPTNGTLTVELPFTIDGTTLQAASTEDLIAVIMPVVEDRIRGVLTHVIVQEPW